MTRSTERSLEELQGVFCEFYGCYMSIKIRGDSRFYINPVTRVLVYLIGRS